jgi:hypothetical protein
VRLKGDADSVQSVNDFKTRTGAMFTAEVGEIKSRASGGYLSLSAGHCRRQTNETHLPFPRTI